MGKSGGGASGRERKSFESPDPIEELRKRVDALRAVRLPELPPFVSGAVGYAGYDVVRYSEQLPNAPPDDRHLPDLSFAFYDRMVVFDNITKTIVVVAMARVDAGRFASGLRRRLPPRGRYWSNSLAAPAADLPPVDISPVGDPKIAYQSNFTQAEFQKAVEKCVEYIRAGDIFQVVISQRLELPIQSQPFEIYRTLRVVNPSPFMFYLRTPSVTLVGSSPEMMVRVVDGKVTVRPLAGTRRRGPQRRRRPPTGRRTAGRPQGTGRARDAGRFGPQRRGPRGPLRHRRADRRDDDRALQPRDAHHAAT